MEEWIGSRVGEYHVEKGKPSYVENIFISLVACFRRPSQPPYSSLVLLFLYLSTNNW